MEPRAKKGRRSKTFFTSDVRLSLRAVLCLSLPLVIGFLVHQIGYGSLIDLGALWAVSQDGKDRWAMRRRRLRELAVMSAVGFICGAGIAYYVGSKWWEFILLGVLAVVAGVVEASRRSPQGMYFLAAAIIAVGIGFSGKIWQTPLCLFCGCLWVYVVALLMEQRTGRSDERQSLADGFGVLALYLSAIAKNEEAPLRQRTLRVLDIAQDIAGSEFDNKVDAEKTGVYQCLIVLLQVAELMTLYRIDRSNIDRRVIEALRSARLAVLQNSAKDAARYLSELSQKLEGELHTQHRTRIAGAFSPPQSSLITRSTFHPTLRPLPIRERLRFAVLLAGAILSAEIVGYVLHGIRSYWLALAVAFIFRPDQGPVLRRALSRSLGTAGGVAIAALVALSGNNTWLLIALCCLMAMGVPWAAQRSQLLTVLFFTPIVFVFISVAGPDQSLFVPRIVDTVLAAAIVMILDLFVWVHAPSMRPIRQYEAAQAATAAYIETDATVSPVERHSRRRGALRAVDNARSAIAREAMEFHPFHRYEGSLDERLADLDADIDRHTVALILRSQP